MALGFLELDPHARSFEALEAKHNPRVSIIHPLVLQQSC